MKKLALLFLLLVAIPLQAQWVSMYWATWTRWNAVPVDVAQIDFSTGTHWIAFTMGGSNSNGTFDHNIAFNDAEWARSWVNAVHAAGKVAILGTGGWGSDYTGAVTNRATSIAFLTGLMQTYGYDGFDIDWEPVPEGQRANFVLWVKELKSAMLAVNPNAVLTAASFGVDPALAMAVDHLDQINLMTYDMSGPWPGWVSWHNSAIYNGGHTFPSTGGRLPAIDDNVNAMAALGVPLNKIGFGIELYGYVWNGVNQPEQTGFGNVRDTYPYFSIFADYYQKGYPLQWDAVAQAAYYSTPGQFVSFDAETTMVVKANYLRSKGLGGVIVFEYAGGYVSSITPHDRMAKQVKYAFLDGAPLDPLPVLPPPVPPPPAAKSNAIVYDEGLASGYLNTSWSAVANFKSTFPVATGSYAVKVQYNAWGGFDVLLGANWGQEKAVWADSLRFDIYPEGADFTGKISFYAGKETLFGAPAGQWTRLVLPGPLVEFTRFYIYSDNAGVVNFDNIQFVSGEGTPPPPIDTTDVPPVVVTPCDSVMYYNRGFAAGVASVVPVVVHDTVKVYPPQVGWHYLHTAYSGPDSLVSLPGGFVVTGTAYVKPKVTIRGLKPRY